MDSKVWLVRGYTKTGIYAEVVMAATKQAALREGMAKIAKLNPVGKVLQYTATLSK